MLHAHAVTLTFYVIHKMWNENEIKMWNKKVWQRFIWWFVMRYNVCLILLLAMHHHPSCALREWTSICICLYLYSAHEKLLMLLHACLLRLHTLLQLQQTYALSNACMHEWKITTNVIKHRLLYHSHYCAPISKGQRFSQTCNLLVSSAVISVSWSTFSSINLYIQQNEGVI